MSSIIYILIDNIDKNTLALIPHRRRVMNCSDKEKSVLLIGKYTQFPSSTKSTLESIVLSPKESKKICDVCSVIHSHMVAILIFGSRQLMYVFVTITGQNPAIRANR